MKRVLSLFVALVMVLALMPAGAVSVSAATSGDYTYSVSNGKATITGYTGAGGDIAIPSTLGGYSVTSIDDSAFMYCSSLISVTIPDSVTSIGHSAFQYCDNLTSVTIPNSVTIIELGTFYNCGSLISVTIPDGITSIEWGAFYGCNSLTSVSISDNISAIGDYAFSYCTSLTDVYYQGAVADRANITIGIWNDLLVNATWHYNSCIGKAKHTYTNACDTSCNVCNATRKTTHKYETTTKKATLTKNGSIVKACTRCDKVSSKTTIRYAKTIKLSKTTYIYNGKAQKPTVTVKDSAGKTISSKYYTVTYASGRKNVGTYKVTVKFKTRYSGSKTLTFKINPSKTTVKKLTAAKKSLKVSITKKSSQVSGYQVQYATSKKFTKATTKTVKSYKTTSYTIKSLSAKKTYYVRVRTYKTVNGKKYYSGWSTYKYKKTQ